MPPALLETGSSVIYLFHGVAHFSGSIERDAGGKPEAEFAAQEGPAGTRRHAEIAVHGETQPQDLTLIALDSCRKNHPTPSSLLLLPRITASERTRTAAAGEAEFRTLLGRPGARV